jgi:hypothetical protein
MSDKATLLQKAETAFTELRESLAGLDEELGAAEGEPGNSKGRVGRVFLGTWGAREIVVHISGWHRAMIPAFARLGRGESPFPDGVSYDDYDAWNARFVEDKKGERAAAVLAELEASHKAFVTAAAALPDKHFAEGETARSLLEGAGAPHYREHSAQIREWRAASR